MLGPRGAFDEDAIPDDNDDEDLKDDPISRMDMTVSSRKFASISLRTSYHVPHVPARYRPAPFLLSL